MSRKLGNTGTVAHHRLRKPAGEKKPQLNLATAVLSGILVALVILWVFNFQALETIQSHSLLNSYTIQTTHRKNNNNNNKISRPNSPTNNNNHTSTSREQIQSSYAYVWVIGGIKQDSYGYKGFVWDVLISANLLRKLGSKADFYIYVRLSPNSNLDDLPSEDRRLLEALGIHIVLLEKPQHESFGQLVFDKFLTINITDYKRVMFLDADIIPLANLDYLFHLSDPDYTEVPTLLKPNVITASLREPCNTGMFIVEPSKVGFEQYQEAVRQQRERAKNLPYPHFDMEEGWGHSFVKHKEFWQAVIKRGNRWHFHASHSDQGLMLYWAKYLRQNVTIVISDNVQNWKPGSDGEPVLESENKGILASYQSEPLRYQWSCDHPEQADEQDRSNGWRCHPPFNGMAHFMGKTKPWQREWKPFRNSTRSYRQRAAKYLWFDELVEINEKLQMGLDMKHWDSKYSNLLKDTSLGYVAQFKDQKKIFGIPEEDTNFESVEESQSAIVTSSTANATLPPVVAYAVSFIKCGDHQNNAAGLIDASLVLRHSIHKISCRNPNSGSKYDYKMYAIVHRQAQDCTKILEKTGFEVVIVDPPLDKHDIQGDFLRNHIHKERCCGHDEFIKLHAYKLPEDIIVHVDIDFAFYKPMDHLFDAILHDKDTPIGKAARNAIELERPGEVLPDKIGAFLTRDWPQVIPGKWPPGYQAGFLVARRDPSVADEMVQVLKEGNYTEGWGYGYGWGNKGYGGWVGAMAMQGLVAYYYDYIRPNNAVELNQCRYNHMGMDVKFKGKCRNGSLQCEDCMQTEMNDIYSMHYTMCRKPWLCQAIGARGGKKPNGGGRGSALNTDVVNVEHCLLMAQKWHLLRSDLESSIYNVTKEESVKLGSAGDYRRDIFQGHCNDDGAEHYLTIANSDEKVISKIQDLYQPLIKSI